MIDDNIMNSKNELVSLIVPVYNVDEYLPICLDSIERQNYNQLEVILVDDGSTDNSGNICDNFAKEKHFFTVKVIHQKNSGVSAARNQGIKLATGKYLAFIDSDDYVSPEYISKMYFALKKFDADYVVSRIQQPDEELSIKNDIQVLETSEIKERLKIRGSVCGKLYVTYLIQCNSLAFPLNQKSAEDTIFNLSYIPLTRRMVFIPDNLYFYIQRNNSATHSFLPDYVFCRHLQTEGVKEFYSHFPKMNQEYRNAITVQDVVNDLSEAFTYYNKYSSPSETIKALNYLLKHNHNFWTLETGNFLSSSAKKFLKNYRWELHKENATCLYLHMILRKIIRHFYK